ncbi:TRADD-N-associated membrane domain-containing protein [Methyloceanibacter sp.]|uniref:TRADD-N-associated membrane domain-containing protein n=1 Tax=Methyloceanibacter sp. TaxID=1965321 RepID=UPI003D6D20DD
MNKKSRAKAVIPSDDSDVIYPMTFSWKSFLATIAASCAIILGLYLAFVPAEIYMTRNELSWIALNTTIFAALIYFFILGMSKWIFKTDSRVDKIRRSSEQLQGALEQDFVTNLVRINFKYIDAYYLQTRIQADKSFTFTVIAAFVSLILIIAGIILTFFGKIESAKIAAASGILGQFISAVFFYLYNQTVAKMADYHRKLVFTQNIGLALKISDGLPTDEKTKSQVALIETLSTNINQYLGA